MNRFTQALLTDEELQALTDRFAAAAKLLKVDELKIEHNTDTSSFRGMFMPESTMMCRLGDRWLGTQLDWDVIEAARTGNFDRMSKAAMVLAKLLHEGKGVPIAEFRTQSRFAAVAGELEFEPEKKS